MIAAPASPAVLRSIRPEAPRPGELVWMDGSEFAGSDEVQLTDTAGQVHSIYNSSGGSGPNTISFTLPANVAAGSASIRVVEHRSGTSQVSNVLFTTIHRGPTPLDIYS